MVSKIKYVKCTDLFRILILTSLLALRYVPPTVFAACERPSYRSSVQETAAQFVRHLKQNELALLALAQLGTQILDAPQ